MAVIDDWDRLAGHLGLLCRSWDAELRSGTRRAILWLDFNTPHARDALKMPAMLSAAANCARILGPENVAFLVWLPNYQKQDSHKTTDEDDHDIYLLLKKSGFLVQRRVRMGLSVHPTVANKTTELEWFADGRLALLCKTEADIKDWWITNSELFRTKRVADIPQLPMAADLVPLTSMDADAEINQEAKAPDVAAKCAQRGPNVAEVQLKAVLSKTTFTKVDELIIVDFMPYVGDRALGTYQFTKSPEAENIGRIRHVIVKMQSKGKTDKSADFAVQRLTNLMLREWRSRTIVLKDESKDSLGNIKEVPVYPNDTVPAPTDEQLRSIAGGVNAYKGLANLPLKACYLRGSKVKIQPAKLEELQGAPLAVAEAIEALCKEHEDSYENLLAEGEESQNTAELNDSRRDPNEGATEAPPMELASFDSLEIRKSTCNIVSTAKAIDRSITLLKDDKDTFYLMSSKDMVLSIGTHVGGIGGGSGCRLRVRVQTTPRTNLRWFPALCARRRGRLRPPQAVPLS